MERPVVVGAGIGGLTAGALLTKEGKQVLVSGPRRLPYKTPVSGLYLTGHWTQPGSGIWTVVLSGINAARYVLGKDMSKAIWPLDF